MVKIYFSGLNASKLICGNYSDNHGTLFAIDTFFYLLCKGMTDIEIGWDYFLIWKESELYIYDKIGSDNFNRLNRPLKIPEHANLKFKQAIAGSEIITILTNDNNIWIYNIYTDIWKKVSNFILITDIIEKEFVVKVAQGRCIVALTNLGHVFNIPVLLNNQDSIKFIDIACGYDHTLLLTQNGNVYTTGMGTRGQLGHGDLEDCDEPKLVKALAGVKVVQIAASGWHNAVITNQGDLYTWGWNNQGQLGHPNIENVVSLPTVVNFINEIQEIIEYNVIKVQCGSMFTICMTDNNKLWGCGSNKYGQLAASKKDISILKQFTVLKFNNLNKSIEDFKCREWGSCFYTS